jgi:hypothetical protein
VCMCAHACNYVVYLEMVLAARIIFSVQNLYIICQYVEFKRGTGHIMAHFCPTV